MKAHKHADAIKAWADGAQIQYKCDISGWVNVICPLWEENSEYRVKPAAPKWPETTIHWTVLDQIFTPLSADERKDLIAVANAALRHACETGQVVTKEAYEKVAHSSDRAQRALLRAGFSDDGSEEWKPPVNPLAAELTAAIAGIESRDENIEQLRATVQRKSSLIAELRADREARDVAVATATKRAVIDAWACAASKHEKDEMEAVNLAAIIAEVKP